jgi:hypothetical protein
MATQTNITLKFKDVKVEEITCEKVTIGKGGNVVPLLRYGSDKKTLNIQGPWIKMKQYGIPPGKTLSNGEVNKFYNSEESRLSIRFPIDEKCCCNISPDSQNTNEAEITEFINFLKKLDNHIKKIITDEDPNEYTSIYRKGIKAKSNTSSNIKFYSMKAKLDTGKYKETKDNKETEKIMTEIHEYNNETGKYDIANNPSNNQITLDNLEKIIKFNSEVLPIIKLVKIWTQDNNKWGVTLKLEKIRVKNPVYSEKGSAIFLEDGEDEYLNMPPEPPVSKKVAEVDSDSDSESDDEPVKVSKSKKIDSDSEEEVVKPTKQIMTVPDSDSDEDEAPKKSAKKPTKSRKAVA